MERWLSWSKAHDWKSCVPHKGTEGSNPSLSAMKKPVEPVFRGLFCTHTLFVAGKGQSKRTGGAGRCALKLVQAEKMAQG